MDKDSKFTRDEEGYIAVRTVSAPYSSGNDDKDSMFTRDEDGYVAVRTISGSGGGGGDQHNLGYYTTPEALEEAHPTAEAGDWAIVGTTDTVWIWDTDNSEWVDSDQKGQVTSVNSKTGAVVLDAKDVNAIPQYETMPTASASNLGDLVQYNGSTTESYTNGYFYKSGAAYSDASATISQTVGSGLTNLAVDVEAFENEEQPTGDESVSFVAEVETGLTVTSGSANGLSLDITDVALCLQKAQEELADLSVYDAVSGIAVQFVKNPDSPIVYNALIETVAANAYNITITDPTEWGMTITGSPIEEGTYYWLISGSSVTTTTTWYKNSSVVDITDYGVSYTGTPATGDTLTVVYTAPVITGYAWEQVNVQSAAEPVGINWAASVDIPANTGLGWQCLPIYELEKPLADGEYEFYWQKTNVSSSYSSDSPLLVSTYKARFRIYNNGLNITGQLSPVIDGEYFADNTNVWRSWQSYSSFKVHTGTGKWYLWMDESAFWGSNIPAYDDSRAVENAFRLSTIKNVNTGEEIGSTGTLNTTWPNVDYYINGVLFATSLAPEPYIPAYFRKGTINFSDMTSQYIMVFNYPGISTTEGTANCSELDIALSSSTGGKYHIIIENGVDNYIANLIEASGDLADVQVGYDTNNSRVIVYLNMQSLPQSGYITLCIGTKGSSYAPDSNPISAPSDFTALSPMMVGSTIMPNVVGRILQYTGTTTASYTNGYFYKANGTIVTVPQSTTAYDISPNTVSISIDADDLIQAIMGYTGWTESYTISMLKEVYQWHIKLDDNGNIEYVYWGGWGNFMTDSGVPACFTVTNATAGSTTEFYVNYTPESQEVQNQSWDRVDVQPGSSLPSQTGNAGKFLTTDGTDASWSDTISPFNIKMQNVNYSGGITFKGVGNNNSIFQLNMVPSQGQIEIDVRNNSGTRTGYYNIDSAIYPRLSGCTLGKATDKWDNVYTTKINNGGDITVPAVAGEMAVKQVNTTITLTAAGWSSNTQTVNVTGMTATGVVMVSPDPTDQSAYTSAGILCTAQAAGTLTFTCDTVPSADIDVNVVML